MRKIFLLFVMLVFCLSLINVVRAGYWEYQEQPNSYLCQGNWSVDYPCINGDDGDWDSSCMVLYPFGNSDIYYFNITKKNNLSLDYPALILSIKDFTIQFNISVPDSCVNYVLEGDDFQFRIDIFYPQQLFYARVVKCYNSTGDWESIHIRESANAYSYYELASYQYILIPEIWFENGTAENNATLIQNFIYVDWDYNLSGWDYVRVITILWNESMAELGDMCQEYNPDIKNCTIEILTSGKYFYMLELAYNNFTNWVHSEVREINLVEPEIPEEDIAFKLNIQNRIVVLITILLMVSFIMFMCSKFGKKGMSKLSIFLVMLFALSLKVLAVEYDYVRENNLLNIITIFLILGILYFIYQKFFRGK